MRLYLLSGEHAGYLRPTLSPVWDGRMKACDIVFAKVAEKAHKANVPVALVEVPSLGQATLVSLNSIPSGLDPYAFNERLRQISERHGIQFIDVLDAFRHGPEANKLFYVVDGHLNGAGSALVSNALAQQLIKDQRAALLGQSVAQQRVAQEREK